MLIEFIYFGSRQWLSKCSEDTIRVINKTIDRCSTVRYLRGYLNPQLDFKEHINTKCKAAILNILRIHNIRRYVDKDITHLLFKSLAFSHLDYADSLLTGLSAKTIKIMQNVQKLAAKVILGKHKSESSTEYLKTLHWLPIKSRIHYKVCTFIFKSLHGIAPAYLSKLITIKQQRRQGLRSENMENILEVPRTKRKTFALQAFIVYEPKHGIHYQIHCKESTVMRGLRRILKPI